MTWHIRCRHDILRDLFLYFKVIRVMLVNVNDFQAPAPEIA